MRVEDIDCFESLRDCWNVILERNTLENNNVFLTWEWVSTWWKYFGKGRKLLILVVKDNEEILAIAPLMLSAYKLLRSNMVHIIASDCHNEDKRIPGLSFVYDILKRFGREKSEIYLNDAPEAIIRNSAIPDIGTVTNPKKKRSFFQIFGRENG